MLQLLKLEAYGFKSFADKLNIEFGRGVTAIVGPNGSGKSNITDAVRWVLGEQNVRNLRGIKSEDVIFSGSSERRRLSAAEVSLVFDNSGGELPLEYQEVTVTRRIFRSGESEYCINKLPCRLRDIHALLADTGLGRDAMSVISQNKVDYVLNSKPEERRELFEEAAGISRYRSRKKEALRKLEETEKNRLRVADIIAEIEGSIEHLAAEAVKTRRYNELKQRYEQAKTTLLLNKYDKYDSVLQTGKREKKTLVSEQAAAAAAINNNDVAKGRLAAELAEVDREMQQLAVRIRQFGSEAEQNTGKLAVLQEKLHQGELAKARLTALLLKTASREQQSKQRLAENAHQSAANEQHIKAAKTALAGVNTSLQQLGSELEFTQAALEGCQARQVSELKEQLQLENDISAGQTLVSALRSELAELNSKLAELNSEHIACQQAYDKLLAAQRQAKQDFAVLAAQADKLQIEAAAQQHEQQRLNVAMDKQRQASAAAEHKLTFLRSLQTEYEGFGRAVKAVLTANTAWHSRICGAVAELIRVPAQYITAVEIALGGAQQNIVAADTAAVKQAIEYLKQRHLGRATFLPLDTVRRGFENKGQLDRYAGFIGYAADLVEFDERYRTVMEFAFRRTVVMRSLEEAMALAKAENYRVRLVTLAGELISPGGSFTGGSLGRREASFFSRVEEIAAQKQAQHEAAEQLKALEKQRLSSLAAAEQQTAKLTAARQALSQWEIAAAEGRLRISQAKQELARSKGQLGEQTAAAAAKKAALRQAEKTLRQQQNKLAALALPVADETAALQKNIQELQAKRRQEYSQQTELKIKLASYEQEQTYLIEKQHSEEQALADCRSQTKAAEQELAAIRTQQDEFAQSVTELTAAAVRLTELKKIGERDYSNFQQVRLTKAAEMQQLEGEMQELRRRAAELASRLHQQELDMAKYSVLLEQCQTELAAYGLTVEQARAGCLKDSSQSLAEESLALEKELASLGSVNPNAVAEYEALDERYRFLKTQADDLVKSHEYLTNIIAEIDTTMARQFKEAFAAIGEHFKTVFVRLFGGGAAELRLCGDKGVLESGIEISVQPPGKKMNGLAVLSGGERALTVISLLFAFLQYKPAPFVVVDEIDAPLDEANVERFGRFLREYSQNTQFIVVTHRKGTMQAADVLYGVTASRAGVSRLISVKLEDIEA